MDLKSKIILIYGPTSSGKSEFAIKLAKKISGQIINADSMQVYKELKVLTARPFKKDYQNIFYENIHSDLILDKIKQNEKCIIYQGNLYHKDLKLNVQPDLIIHRDIFKEIFNQVNLIQHRTLMRFN